MRKHLFVSICAATFATTLFLAGTPPALSDPDTTARSASNGNMYLPRQKFSVDFGLSFANPESDVTQSSSGTVFYRADKSDSETVTSVGVDYRVPLFLFIPNFGNVIVGNVDTVDRGPIFPKGPIAGAWGRAFLLGDDQTNAGFDIHTNPAGIDSHSQYSRDFFFLPYLGYEFGVDLGNGNYGDLTVFGGPRIEKRKAKFMTNENGTWSTFTNSETDIGFTIGADLDIPFTVFNIGNAGNIGVANTPFGPVPFVRLGFALDYSPDIEVSGRSTATNFDYEDRIDGGFTSRFFVGAGISF